MLFPFTLSRKEIPQHKKAQSCNFSAHTEDDINNLKEEKNCCCISLTCHTHKIKNQSRKFKLALLTKKLPFLIMTSFDNKITLKQLNFANREFMR